MRSNRRDFLRMAGASALVAACTPGQVAVPPSTPTPGTPKPVRALKVGHLARQLGNLVPLYDEVGPKHSVKFEVSLFPDGAALLAALTTGDILLAAPTKVQLVQAMSRGVDLAMVCGYAGGYVTFITRKDSSATAGDWKTIGRAGRTGLGAGRPRIGVPTASLQYVSTLERLKAAGIDSERDVEMVNVPFNEHVNALDAGQIDLAGALSLFAAQGLVQDKVKLFEHAKSTPIGHFDVGFITTRKLAKERPDDLQDIVSAHYEAMQNIIKDPTHGLAREVKYSELPEAVVRKSYEFLTFDHRVDVAAIRATERVMRDLKLHVPDLSGKVDEYVDLSFLAKAAGKPVADVGKW